LAKHRSKREVSGLLRRLDPLPDVPARIEPLGPAPQGRPLQSGTHAQFTAALAGPVRELPPGDRPSDWLEGENDETAAQLVQSNLEEEAVEQPPDEEPQADSTLQHERLLAPQRYKVQFTASQEYVDLLEQAKDLLAPAVRSRDLEQVHLRALRALVSELKKRKYAVTDRPRPASAAQSQNRSAPARTKGRSAPARASKPPPSNSKEGQPLTPTALPASPATELALRERQRGTARKAERNAGAGSRSDRAKGKSRSRNIPAAVRRAVAERDQYRCTYVDDRGLRCRETSGLEFHHEHAYSLGGPATVANIAMRCRAHNALAAEQDYGREFMQSLLLRASVPTKKS
jgi:5-methylcytosine-specific restriction endonuclease McrA